MAGLETAVDFLSNIHFNTTMFGQSWLMYMIIIVATLLIITRKWSDFGELALPVMVGWRYFGMPVPSTFFLIGILTFVISTMSFKMITGAFEGISAGISALRDVGRFRAERSLKKEKYANRRIEIREEMEKLKDYASGEEKRRIRRQFERDNPDWEITKQAREELRKEKIKEELKYNKRIEDANLKKIRESELTRAVFNKKPRKVRVWDEDSLSYKEYIG